MNQSLRDHPFLTWLFVPFLLGPIIVIGLILLVGALIDWAREA